MNILFLTMNVFTDIDMHNIYSDLMKEFVKHGHRPYIVTPREKKTGEATALIEYETYGLLKVQVGNTSKVSLIEKGISTITLSKKFYSAVIEELGDKEFGLILYSTPPITLAKPVKKLKKKFNCQTYLMLKDIFPQNAVDLEMFSAGSLIYKYFREREKELYRISDHIGCMSLANVDYVIKHNQEIDLSKLEICPNSIEVIDKSISEEYKRDIRKKYNIPLDKKIFVYGGNLGKPQGVSFLIECLIREKENEQVYFLIVGDGTEYSKLQAYVDKENPSNVRLMKKLPRSEYDMLVAACDVGMIFLDYRFTIPNFPSRILSYMQAKIPVFAVTDSNTDIGTFIVSEGFGWWSESNHLDQFELVLKHILEDKYLQKKGAKGYRVLCEKFSSETGYQIISSHFE